MSALRILSGAAIHDGLSLLSERFLVLQGDTVAAITDDPPAGPREVLDGGTILPGFVDLQVNGGGGVMFNDAQTPEALATILTAHATTGTRAILPTLISDTADRTQAAVEAVAAAIDTGAAGIAGLHLEGPHLDPRRKGAHAAQMLRPMTDADLSLYLGAAERLANLMITLAPENATPEQIAALCGAGVRVSLGHTAADYETCRSLFDAGASLVTHLFNAMGPLAARAPGLVGAALDTDGVAAGVIADGIHVHPATLRAAVAAKRGASGLFLVTDAMATAGADIEGFVLNARQIRRGEGRLTLADGTLAGADLDMPKAIRVMTGEVGLGLEQVIAMATGIPAGLLPAPGDHGRLRPGRPAHAIHLSADLRTVTPL